MRERVFYLGERVENVFMSFRATYRWFGGTCLRNYVMGTYFKENVLLGNKILVRVNILLGELIFGDAFLFFLKTCFRERLVQ